MKRSLAVLFLATLCLLSVEAAGALFCLWSTGKLVYFAREQETGQRADQPSAGTRTEAVNTFPARLHPYFGYVGPYEGEIVGLHWNALGSLQREPIDIPYIPAKNDLVVVVFGGSVATNLAISEQGGMPLDLALQSLPEFRDRHVVLINAALGGSKQPAQLFRLAYLLSLGQHIDIAINVDGFNEFALGWQNVGAGLPTIMPAAQNMRPLLARLSPSPASEEFYEAAYRMHAARRELHRHVAARDQSRTGVGYAWASAWAAINQRELAASMLRYEVFVRTADWGEAKRLFSLDLPPEPEADPIEQIFSAWLRSSKQMKALAAASGIAYVHVVQPNQYYSRHVFSEAERALALSLPEGHDYRVGLAKGYALIAARMSELNSAGITSGLDIFDDVTRPVFADLCCHLNQEGETLLARFVAEITSRYFTAGSRIEKLR